VIPKYCSFLHPTSSEKVGLTGGLDYLQVKLTSSNRKAHLKLTINPRFASLLSGNEGLKTIARP